MIFLAAAAVASVFDPGCLADLRRAATASGVAASIFDSATAGFTIDSTIVAARDHQPEFTTPIWDYLALLVDEQRIGDGTKRLAEWDAVLASVEIGRAHV